MKPRSGKVEVKAYSTKEMAGLYGITPKTFRAWMFPFQRKVGRKTGRYYTALQVRMILDKFGLPGEYTLLFLPLFLPLFGTPQHISFGIMEGIA